MYTHNTHIVLIVKSETKNKCSTFEYNCAYTYGGRRIWELVVYGLFDSGL